MNISRFSNEYDLPPPERYSDYERVVHIPTDEELRVLERSLRLARKVLEGRVQLESSSNLSYNDFIIDMSARGVSVEFANKALDRMGFEVGADAELVSR